MNKRTKKKVAILSIIILLLTALLGYLIYITFIEDKPLRDLGYSYKQIQVFKEYGIEDEITEYNQSLIYALNSKEFKKENLKYYMLFNSKMDLTIICNKLAQNYSISNLRDLSEIMDQESIEALADKEKIQSIPVFKRMLATGYDMDLALTMTNLLPESCYESFFNVADKIENPLLYLKYLNNGYSDNEIEVIVTLPAKDFANLADINYFKDLPDLIKTSGFKVSNLARYLMYIENKKVSCEVAVKKVNSNADILKADSINYTNAYGPEGEAEENYQYALINKSHKLLSTYVPENLTDLPATYNHNAEKLVKEAADAFVEMAIACKEYQSNINLMVYNGYQSYDKLDELYNNALATFDNDIELTNKNVVKAGFSEHQSGLACDIGTNKYAPDQISISNSSKWLKSNAYRYGFIQRYPSGKETFTKTPANIYHYRYVGKEVSELMNNYGWCFEEYHYLFIANKEKGLLRNE